MENGYMFKVGDYVSADNTVDGILKIVYVGNDHGYIQWAIFEYIDNVDYCDSASYDEVRRSYGNLFTPEKGKEYTWFPIDNYDVKLARVKNTRLAKKLYPKARESEDGKYLIGVF